MYRTSSRPLSGEERNTLEKLSRFSVNTDLGGALTFLLVLGLVGMALDDGLTSILPRKAAISISVGASLIAWAYLSYLNVRARLREKRRFRRDLTAGKVEVIEVQATSIIRQADHEEDDPFYYFVLDDQKAVFLGGQELLDVKPFPTREFTVHRAPASNLVFSIEPRGPLAPPDRTIARNAVQLADFGTFALLDLRSPSLAPLGWA